MTRTRRVAAALLSLPLFLVQSADAGAAVEHVHLQFQAFSPSAVDVLPGDTVEWMNMSSRRHTLTADDGSFDVDPMSGGDEFRWRYDRVGSFPYHCRVHAGMTGRVDVRRVTLGSLPPGLVPTGRSIDVDGRTATPGSAVRVERSTGGPFQTVATASPKGDGTWSASIVAERTADYRAVSGSDTSETRRLTVSDRAIRVTTTKRGLKVKVVPPDPYARIALELRLRERFGWWATDRRKLDYLSEASFRVERRARARVVLLGDDGWTARAVSRTVSLGRR